MQAEENLAPEQSSLQSAESKSDKYTLLALIAALIVYPVLYSTDFFGNILFKIVPEATYAVLLDENSRYEWWYFWLSNMLFHWVPFAFVWMALVKNGQSWQSIGLDLSFFSRYRFGFVALLLVLIVSAFFMPGIHYGNELPSSSSTHFIGAVSSAERLFLIFGAFTAALTEEALFRGFALTRLKRWLSPWLALPLTLIAFVLIHGEPRSLDQVLNYTIAGLAFGVPFILMGLKRLEIIIVVHFLIDASLILAP